MNNRRRYEGRGRGPASIFISRQRDYGGSEVRTGGGNKNLFDVVSEIGVPLCGSIDKQDKCRANYGDWRKKDLKSIYRNLIVSMNLDT